MASSIDGYSLVEAQAQLTAWKAAVAALASSQSYQIGQRQLTRVDLADARAIVKYFAGIVDALSGTRSAGVRAVSAVPRDL